MTGAAISVGLRVEEEGGGARSTALTSVDYQMRGDVTSWQCEVLELRRRVWNGVKTISHMDLGRNTKFYLLPL